MAGPLTTSQPEGVLLVDKPKTFTSHDVVSVLRRIYGLKKIGHAGTLDPIATGLLILLIGKATKVSQYLMSLDKTYTGSLRLGQETNTQDADGEITAEAPVPDDLDQARIQAAMNAMTGDQYQTPPMYSAKKVDGVPLYKHARKGKEVEREPRFIHVARYQCRSVDLPEATYEVACSKGTYVRTLVHDLGKHLGCGAHMTDLRRTRIDRFSVEDAVTLTELEAMSSGERLRRLIPVYRVVPSHVL
ncbi:MAG: tRNA pseudouridine(55) synthase TruB [Opitutales bacterium]